MIALERTSANAVRAYEPAELVTTGPDVIPSNLVVPGIYRPLLESMLRQSPTFRRQCLRIAQASQLTVSLELASAAWPRTGRARTLIVRRPAGRLSATVVIGQPVHAIELIAHEIEHIIEQLDEVDLASKAALPDSGVQEVGADGVVFETIRARRAGLKVAEEVRGTQQARVWRP